MRTTRQASFCALLAVPLVSFMTPAHAQVAANKSYFGGIGFTPQQGNSNECVSFPSSYPVRLARSGTQYTYGLTVTSGPFDAVLIAIIGSTFQQTGISATGTAPLSGFWNQTFTSMGGGVVGLTATRNWQLADGTQCGETISGTFVQVPAGI